MKKSSRIYVLYTAAVLAVGAVYMHFHSDKDVSKPEKGNVSIFVSESTSAAKKEVSTTTKKTAEKQKTTTTKAVRTTTAKTTTEKVVTETIPTEPEILWLDINEADAEELEKLPEIGAVLAAEIVSYRESAGGFRNIEEIMNVSGIGEAKFDAIREYIYVVDPVYDEEQETEESTDTEETEPSTTEERVLLDLNKATMEELMQLPYVDENIAMQIIEFRERYTYRNPYELLYIKELNREQVEEILEYVTVEDSENAE